MTTTSELALRPLGLGELLDQAIRLYRRNFFKFIGIIAVVQIPLTFISLAVTLLTYEDFAQVATNPTPTTDPLSIFTPGYFIGLASTLFVGFMSFLLIQGVATAALTRQVADTYLGETGGMFDAYRRIGNRWLPLIGTLLLYALLGIAVFIWLIIPCIGWLTGPGMLGVLGWMILPLVAPVVVIENSSGIGAIRRAWDLVRRRFWWVLGFMFILFLFAMLVISGPAALVSAGLQFVLPSMLGEASDMVFIMQTILQSITNLFFSLLYLPLQLVCMTLLYFDLRVRHEGLDLMLMAEGEQTTPMKLSDLVAQTPPAPTGNVVTWNEVGYMVLLTFAGVILYVLIFVVIFGIIGLAGGF